MVKSFTWWQEQHGNLVHICEECEGVTYFEKPKQVGSTHKSGCGLYDPETEIENSQN